MMLSHGSMQHGCAYIYKHRLASICVSQIPSKTAGYKKRKENFTLFSDHNGSLEGAPKAAARSTAGYTQLMTCCSSIVHMQESTQMCLNGIGIIKATSMSTAYSVYMCP